MGDEINDGEAKAISDAGAGLESIVSSLNKLTVPIVGTQVTAEGIAVSEGSKQVGAGGGVTIVKGGDTVTVGNGNQTTGIVSKGGGGGSSTPDEKLTRKQLEALGK